MTQRASRRLWLCADDYGIAPGVDRAIRDLIGRGRINATSVMVVAPGFFAHDAQALVAVGRGAIGLHFTLTAPFRPSTAAYRPMARSGTFLTLPRTMVTGLARRLDAAALAAEVASQLAMFRSAFGRPPDFIDGHQHVHLLPQVGDAVLAAVKTSAPGAWVRQCGRVGPLAGRGRDPKAHLLDVLSRRMRRRCATAGIATNPAFAGAYNFKRDAAYDSLFGSFLDHLPDGGVVMCHPGFVDAQLQSLDDLTTRREQEYAFFAAEGFPQFLAARGFVLA